MENANDLYRLPKLPYSVDAFGEFLSRESFACHYDKHHQAYLTELNSLIRGTSREKMTLEEILHESSWGDSKIYNQAAQAWNHAFLWHSLSPEKIKPNEHLQNLIERAFGSLAAFKDKWVERGASRFGSGWVWLVVNEEEKLALISTSNAENPLLLRQKPLLCADLWEHAYYLDHRHDRKKYLTQFFGHLNWDFAAENLAAPHFPKMGETMRKSSAI